MVTKKILIGTLLIIVSAIGVKAFAHSRLSKEEKVKHITEKWQRNFRLLMSKKQKYFKSTLTEPTDTKTLTSKAEKEVIQNAVAKWRTDLKQVLNVEQAQKLKI